MSRAILSAAVLGAMLCLSQAAHAAEDWPSKSIKMIVPLPAGSAADTIARLVSEELSNQLHQPVIVINRPGASGEIGTNELVSAEPDGYTFGVATSTTLVTAPLLDKRVKYDPLKDVATVALIGTSPYVFVVHPKVPAHDLKQFIALAKQKPGGISYSSVGEASLAHLAASLFSGMSGIQLTEVPYKSSTQAVLDLLAGRIDSQFGILTTTHQYIKDGKLRALGITSKQRLPRFPDLPTIDESGLPGFEASLWLGVIAPAKTPKPIVDKVNAMVNAMLARDRTKEVLFNQAIFSDPLTPAQMTKMLEEDLRKWKEVSQKEKLLK